MNLNLLRRVKCGCGGLVVEFHRLEKPGHERAEEVGEDIETWKRQRRKKKNWIFFLHRVRCSRTDAVIFIREIVFKFQSSADCDCGCSLVPLSLDLSNIIGNMHWAYLTVFALAIGACWSKEDESNEISSQPPINLDAKLRRALLKALTELENEEIAEFNKENQSNSIKPISLDDKVVEKASASAVSFYANTDGFSSVPPTSEDVTTFVSSSTTSITTPTTTEAETEKPLVVIQKSNGIQHKPITSFVTVDTNDNIDPVAEAENIATSASSSFNSPQNDYTKNDNLEARSVGGNYVNSISSSEIKKSQKYATTQKPPATTPAVTVVPTEENEAKVEDVQFFSAPLVAAFTVHQDERGLPKSVEPIYRSAVNAATKKQFETERLKQLEEQRLKELEEQRKQEQLKQQQTQTILQEKQRALEQQLLKLQQQQQHQDFLLRQQQIFQEQQLQLQKQRLLEEQARLQRNQLPFVPIPNPVQNQLNSVPSTTIRNQFRSKGTSGTIVSLEPSITPNIAIPQSPLPLNAQQLPTKVPASFNQPFIQTPQILVPLQPVPQFQPVLQNFKYTQSFQPLPNSNRIFRQEPQNGNFFNPNFNNNNNLNTLNTFVQVPPFQQTQHNRFFRSNAEGNLVSPSNYYLQPPTVNQHLNNLLYHSGVIRGRPHEDLSIVSKVLSLNHIGNRDQIFGASNVEQRYIPILKKVDKKV